MPSKLRSSAECTLNSCSTLLLRLVSSYYVILSQNSPKHIYILYLLWHLAAKVFWKPTTSLFLLIASLADGRFSSRKLLLLFEDARTKEIAQLYPVVLFDGPCWIHTVQYSLEPQILIEGLVLSAGGRGSRQRGLPAGCCCWGGHANRLRGASTITSSGLACPEH